jgi:hypothetical protein
MASYKKNTCGGTALICVWLVVMLLLSSGRNILDPHTSLARSD